METLIFFLIIGFTLLYAVVEALHDYYVIRNEVGYTDDSKKWHLWGLIQNLLGFVPIFIVLFIWDPKLLFPVVLVVSFLFWQIHDSLIGILFFRRPFYLGNHGIDRHLNEIFNGGFNLFIVRAMFMTVGIINYFRAF